MKKQFVMSILVLTLLYFVSSTIGLAQTCSTAGCLDDTFGTGGRALNNINFGAGENYAKAVQIQPDGKKVTAVQAYNHPAGTGQDFYVMRYDIDGSLDYGFGSGGITRITFTSAMDIEIPNAIALQADGKIVVAGQAQNSSAGQISYVFAIARLNSDGTPDTSFGSGGKKTFGFASNDSSRAHSVVIQPDGNIVVAGDSGSSCAFSRLTPNGAFDTTFNGTGKLTLLTNKNTTCFVNSLALQPDGKIVSGGYQSSKAGRDFAVIRLNADGKLDSSFGSGGKVITDFIGLDESVRSIAIDNSGRIVAGGIAKMGSAAGRADVTYQRFAVARYNPNGSLDTTFDGDGKVTAGIPNNFNEIKAIIAQSDGKIVASGTTHDQDLLYIDSAIVRFNSNGSLDTTFGSTGIVTSNLDGRDEGFSLAIQPDGKYVTVGHASNGYYVAVARYLP